MFRSRATEREGQEDQMVHGPQSIRGLISSLTSGVRGPHKVRPAAFFKDTLYFSSHFG